MEELLEKARRDYPVGTKFTNIFNNSNKICTVTKNNHNISFGDIAVNADRPHDGATNSSTYIYYKGKWAEIIYNPENYSPEKIYEVWI